jgi:subtilisin family serine protease
MVWMIATVLAVIAASVVPSVAEENAEFEVLPSNRAAAEQQEAEETGRLLVRFDGRAELQATQQRRTDWDARGRAVAEELKDRASRAQSRALGLIRQRRAEASSYWISNTVVVEGTDPALRRQLEQLPGVAEVRPERRYKIAEPVNVKQVLAAAQSITEPDWGVSRIGADRAWDQGVLGGGVVIASIDSGVDHTHPAIAAQYRGNLGNGQFDHAYNWYDASGTCPTAAPCDLDGHGTHTMGTMVGGDGPGPFTPDIGVAPAATWIGAGCGPSFCDESQLMEAGQWIVAPFGDDDHPADPSKRPHIVNNSWGAPGGDTTMVDMVRAWRAAGIVPVFSSGNEGPECGTVGSPGDYPESYTVGATDRDDVIAAFSSRGASLAGGPKPEVSAPGVDVLSAMPGNEYLELSGTSMAAPHVAGALALALSAAPELRHDVAAVTDALNRTAVDRVDLACGGDADGDPNNVYGEGRIDAAAAVDHVASGGRISGRITVSGTGAPLPGARVRALGGEIDHTSITRPDGSFTLLAAPGTYRVAVEAFAYTTATRDGVTVTRDGTTTVDLDLAAAPQHTVRGTVTGDESGAALGGVAVQALGTPVPLATTDADGRWSLRLPAGTYDLRASRGGCTAPATTSTTVEGADVVIDVGLTTKTDRRGHSCEPSSTTWVATSQATGLTGDSAYGRLALPWSVSMYGRSYRSLYVAVDGYLSFNDPYYSNGWNGSLPDPGLPDPGIYPLWQDLRVDDDASITYEYLGTTASTRRVVVTYENVRAAGSDVPVTFQVHIWANGAIDMLYRDMAGVGEGASATIGIEDHTGTDALQFSYRERSVLSNTAWRYDQRATATATGTVVDANDGRAVAGATVAAEPGGRSTTTDRAGRYSLKLLPGSYRITTTAPRYQAATSDPVTVRAGASTSVPALRMPAPIASVSPSSLDVTTPHGQTREGTATLTNTGTAPLHWSLYDRQATTAPVPLAPIGTDPAGDARGTVDVVSLEGSSDGRTLSMKVGFSPSTPMGAALGAVLLDTDQNPATGEPAVNQGGLDTHDIGADYLVYLTPLVGDDPYVEIVRAGTNRTVATAPGSITGQTMEFTIPTRVLGTGFDGSADAVVMVGSFMGATDWLPNEGHVTVEAGLDPDWIVSDPSSGTLAPGASVDVSVRGGSADLPRGDHRAELRFVTDAPRRSKVVVPFRLSVS